MQLCERYLLPPAVFYARLVLFVGYVMDQAAWAERVAAAFGRIKEMTVEELAALLNDEVPITLVDVRREEERVGGVIDGDVSIPLPEFVQALPDKVLDRDKILVIYCAGGVRSAVAADDAMQLGYTQVYSLKGGFKAVAQ